MIGSLPLPHPFVVPGGGYIPWDLKTDLLWPESGEAWPHTVVVVDPSFLICKIRGISLVTKSTPLPKICDALTLEFKVGETSVLGSHQPLSALK